MVHPESMNELQLPEFSPGGVVRETANFRVMMDWKPGLEGQEDGGRFFIEPKTDAAEQMLISAARTHQIANFNRRVVPCLHRLVARWCLRADFSAVNLPSLMLGEIDIPAEGEDSIPPPDRMEECLRLHPESYTFADSVS